MSYERTRKKSRSGKPQPLQWEDVRNLPIGLYHTLKGPIIGFVASSGTTYARIYAPACVSFMPPANVVFLPVAFVEQYLDLSLATMFGVSPTPDIVAKGYIGYFEQFVQGSYRMQPVVTSAAIQAEPAQIEDATIKIA